VRAPETQTSFAEGLRRLCEVDERAGLDPEADPVTIEGERYDWALAHVENPDVIEMVTLMRVKSDAERVQMLRAGCRQAALPGCALADTLAAP
jgi:hypothetical protein